ncbi:MAG TPA: hypothetical protein VFU31_21025 [Candidatus Binatia bacterium]|nr:hypothetical protein [Candidatus Binatia bacterium]
MSEPITVTLEFRAETDLARCYRFKDGTEVWLPRSIIKRTVKFPDSNLHQIELPEWKARQLGLT